jgi:hypothetical protein
MCSHGPRTTHGMLVAIVDIGGGACACRDPGVPCGDASLAMCGVGACPLGGFCLAFIDECLCQ